MGRQRSMETIQTAEYVTIGELVRLTESRYSTLTVSYTHLEVYKRQVYVCEHALWKAG